MCSSWSGKSALFLNISKTSCSSFFEARQITLVFAKSILAIAFTQYPKIFAENSNIGAIECLDQSKKMVYGKRGELFLIFLTEFLLIVFFVLFFSCLLIILEFLIIIPLWLKILIPIFITTVIFLIFVQPYFEILIANMYIDAKNAEKKISKQKSAKSVSKV